jgi:hypothetical protein
MHHHNKFIVHTEVVKIQQKVYTATSEISEQDFDLWSLWDVIWVLVVKSTLLFTQTKAIKPHSLTSRPWNEIM